MCGIAGFWGNNPDSEIAMRMSNAISHRGPDDDGVWVDKATGIALAHRRLSILDLSPAGHQPMVSTCERFVIVFNGEIYNHLDIRRELQQSCGETVQWRGHSDTETLLAAIAAWGVELVLKRCVGMFAFALWDRQDRTLTIARDRLGEKPLYYGWQGELFLFASELKAIKAHPEFGGSINRDALALFLRHSYIPAPYSIYRNIYKLIPGSYVILHQGQREAVPIPYWTVLAAASSGKSDGFLGTEADALEKLECLLNQSIAGQMMADVPLGAFLSGGIDSSTVVALMQAQSSRPVKTFTIGFQEASYDEATHAKKVARHLGTEHTELYVTAAEALDVIPRLPRLYDEPFSDSSQIPTYLVSSMAHRHVTVSLSGDGGDELFGGYNRYFWVTSIWAKIQWLPRPVRVALAGVLASCEPITLDRIVSGLSAFLPRTWRYANPGDKLHKAAEILAVNAPEEIYLRLVSHWKHPEDIVRGGKEPLTSLTDSSAWPDLSALESRMMYLDQITYLPGDILTKVDRAAMGVSLETRVPMLDHRLVEFAWRLPLSMKIRNGEGKWLLRQLLYRHVPRSLIERPKMGFGVPIDTWLRGSLRPWAESLLNNDRLEQQGYFSSEPVRQKWREHLAGAHNWAPYLWDVLMFQAWEELQ